MRSALFPASRATYVGSMVAGCGLACVLFPLWHQLVSFGTAGAILVTALSALWTTSLFISAAHLWQGKSSPLFETVSFIGLLSATLSGFWLLVFFPGVMSHDALILWLQARDNRYVSRHPPLLAMLMHATQCCVDTPSLSSFLGGLLFWGSTFYLIRQTAGSARSFLVQCCVVITVPPLWLHSNATVSNTWASAFMMLSAGALIRAGRARDRRLLIASAGALSVAVMFRPEVALLAVLIIATDLLWFSHRRPWKAAVDVALVLALVAVPARLVEASPRVGGNRGNAAAHGLLNQYVGTVVRAQGSMSRSEVDAEQDRIDREFGEGTFRRLLKRYACDSGDYIIWGRGGPVIVKRRQIRTSFVVPSVAAIALRHPLAFLGHQACYASYLTQLKLLDYQTWGMVAPDPKFMRERARRRVPFESRLPFIWERYAYAMARLMEHPVSTLLFRHYVWLICSGVVLVLGLRARKIELVIPALFSLLYPMAYLMAGTAALWRYLLPSYVFSWIGVLALASHLLTAPAASTSDVPACRAAP